MVSESFSRTNPTGPSGLYKIQKLFFGAHTRANILGSDIVNLWGFDPGFWFCRARNLVQQENVDWKKWGWRLGFCRECRVWSDPCLWFCRGPPHFLTLYLQNASPQPDHPNGREEYMCIFTQLYTCMYVCMYIYIYKSNYICMCIYIYIFVFINVHVYLNIINVYIYIYTHSLLYLYIYIY